MDEVFCSVGTHPNHAQDEREFLAQEMVELAETSQSASPSARPASTTITSARRKRRSAGFAPTSPRPASGLPLVIHSRDSDADMADILEQEHAKSPFKALLHCFTSSRELAERALALGL